MATARCQYRRCIERLVAGRWLIQFSSFVLLLNIAIPCYAQNAEEAVLSLTPSKAVRGQKVTIRIRTTIPWRNTVHIEKPALERIMAWWALPYARPWRTTNENGEVKTYIEVLSAIQIDQPGFHSIAPFRITSGQWEAETPETDIICVNTDEKEYPFPIFAGWRPVADSIWQGQSVPIVLEAQNLAFLSIADSVSLNNVPVGILEETLNSGQIITRYNTDTVIYDVPMASWLWTLAAPGNFDFPGAKFVVNGISRSVDGFSVQVKPLPEECKTSGAVGSFSLGTDWDDQIYNSGDILSIRVSIQGEGNLKVLIPPTPKINDAEFIKSTPESSYNTSKNGYTGIRTTHFEYRILETAVNTGELLVTIPNWTYLQPEGAGRIHTIPAKTYKIAVEATTALDNTRVGIRLLGADMFLYQETAIHTGKTWPYLLLLPGILVFLILLTIRRRSVLRSFPAILVLPFLLSATHTETGMEQADRAKQLALEEQWEDVLDIYNELTAQYGELPGLLHDRAIIESETGQPGEAVTLMRRALHLKPGNRQFIQSMQYIDDKLNLKEQIPPSPQWPPALPFILWIIGVNFLFVVLSWIFFMQKERNFSLLVSSILFLLAATGGLIYTQTIWENPVSIVAWDNQPLKRIPDPLADEWVTLPAGTTVKVKAVEGLNCLVQTGFGLEGWLPIDALNDISEIYYGF